MLKYRFFWLGAAVIVFSVMFYFYVGKVTPISPLNDSNTRSPRDTLFDFRRTVSEVYDQEMGVNGVFTVYMRSERLFLTEEEEKRAALFLEVRDKFASYLDMSGLPKAYRKAELLSLAYQLKEILDRVELPAVDEVPDVRAVDSQKISVWKIPGTELAINKIESGPRQGQFLFSADTVSKINEYFLAIKNKPYQKDATPGIYEFSFRYPIGFAIAFHRVIPPRWFFQLPWWANYYVLQQPVWKWIAFVTVLVSVIKLRVLISRRAKRFFSSDCPFAAVERLFPDIMAAMVIPIISWFSSEIIRMSGAVSDLLDKSMWSLFYLIVVSMVWQGSKILSRDALWIKESFSLRVDQYILAGSLRILGAAASIAILIDGAARVGIPAYSMFAGLGVGGLAVALAGQNTLANFICAILINLEKPFRIGHKVKIGSVEGTVEDITQNSVVLRTHINTLVYIPCSHVVQGSIENYSRRNERISQEVLTFPACVPFSALIEVMPSIKAVLDGNEKVDPIYTDVELGALQYSARQIEVTYALKVHTDDDESTVRQGIRIALSKIAQDVIATYEKIAG